MRVLLIGGGIGGLTTGIALLERGFEVTLIERDPTWSVYGVGIIQQPNVVRAMSDLGLLDDYVGAGVGFDCLEIFSPDGIQVATVPTPRLVPDYPSNVGIGRPALQKVLSDQAIKGGITVRLGITARSIVDEGGSVRVEFSDGAAEHFDLVVGADGIYSTTRTMLFPAAPTPAFAGQAVWRYNFPRPAGMDALQVYNGAIGVGLVPISEELMYMYATTPEPDNARYPREGLAAAMRGKLSGCAPAIRALSEQITDDDGVVYRPLETLMITGPWHKGRVGLLGDAVHAATPHLGQGAGMAIEDGIVLAQELTRRGDPDAAFAAFRERRIERCRYIVERSLAICHGQIGAGPPVDNAVATREMFEVVAQPI